MRFDGVLLLQFAERQFLALLFHPPPRFTRFEPLDYVPCITTLLNATESARLMNASSGNTMSGCTILFAMAIFLLKLIY